MTWMQKRPLIHIIHYKRGKKHPQSNGVSAIKGKNSPTKQCGFIFQKSISIENGMPHGTYSDFVMIFLPPLCLLKARDPVAYSLQELIQEIYCCLLFQRLKKIEDIKLVFIYLSKRCRWEICFYIVIKHISRVTSFWLYSGQLLSEMVPREMSNKMLENLI